MTTVVNPATEEPLAEVALAGEADVDRAVRAARAAYEKVWGPMPGASSFPTIRLSSNSSR